MPEIACEWCGKEFHKKSSQIKLSKHHFCSRICWKKYLKNNHTFVICEQCGRKFQKTPSQVTRSEHHFCSRKCGHIWHRTSPIVTCDQCSKEFRKKPAKIRTSKYNFCSPECRYAWLSIHHRGENAPAWKGGLVTIYCDYCGESVEKEPNQLNGREHHFCSRKCHGAWTSIERVGKNAANWKGGISLEPYGLEFNDDLKELIIQHDNYQCQLCGMIESEHINRTGCRLSVHHINYDKQDNHSSNLIALCRVCHGLTNSRRKYYTRLLSAHIAHRVPQE